MFLWHSQIHTHRYIYIYKDRIEPYKLRVWERILSKDCGHNFPWKPWAQLSLSGACRPEITWVMQTPIRRFNLRETVSPKPMRCLVGSWEEVDRLGWQCDQHFTVFTCLCFHVFPLLHRQISNLELRTCWLAVRELNIDCWSWPVSPFLPAIRECCEMLWEYPRSSDGIGPANAKSGLWRRETPDTSAQSLTRKALAVQIVQWGHSPAESGFIWIRIDEQAVYLQCMELTEACYILLLIL